VLAAVIVTAGAVLVEGAGRVSAAGLAWAGVALACEASFTLLAIPVLGRHGAWGVSVHSVWIGAVMLTVLGLVTEGPTAAARLTPSDLAAVAYLAVLVTVVAFVLWYSTVAALGPARAGVLTGIAPVSAALTGMATGSRAPSLAMWAGIVVVMAGLAAGLGSRARPGLAVSPAAGTAPESPAAELAQESRAAELAPESPAAELAPESPAAEPAPPSRIAEPVPPSRAAELSREGGAA
jgi:threonine/homoserine efflux transporter RhtA